VFCCLPLCLCYLPALRGSYVRLGHVTIYVRPLCIRVMDDVICMPTLYVVHDWLFWDRECMHIRGLGLLVRGSYNATMQSANNVSRITRHINDHEEKQKRPFELSKIKEDE